MTARAVIVVAACLLLVAVVAGAFGAHALRARLSPDLASAYQTGVQYHFVHALGLLCIGVLWMHLPDAGPRLGLAAALMMAGVALFSGSLYLLALTGTRTWGAVTPFGGAAWIAAWALVAWATWRA
jgi:uncharacterized membrane protein YgdD (TMEM256/DUF423 family)